MEREAHETRTATEAAMPPVARRGPGPPSRGVDRLQGGAGNSAVARLLRRRGPAGGPARLARDISGNPGDLPQTPGATAGAPPVAAGTTHAAPTIADAANHAGATAAPAVTPGQLGVRIKATPVNPLKSVSPALDDLYEVQPAAPASGGDTASSSGFNTVQSVRGSVAAPIVDEVADDSLFIDPGPSADDVQQSGIGDCWELATFIGIVSRDPGKIRSIMEPDGKGGAAVTLLYRTETHGLIDKIFGNGVSPNVEYVPERVQVSNELAFARSSAAGAGPTDRAVRSISGGKPYGFRPQGAQLRAAPQPRDSAWFCMVVGDALEVHRVDVFQMARWAPLMEKAAARFSQAHGQYGGAGLGVAGAGEKRDAGQGYANIAGGAPGYLLTVFYGKEGEVVAGGQGDDSMTAQTPPGTGAAAVIKANEAAFQRLVPLNGWKDDGRTTTVPIVTAVTRGEDAYVPRLMSAIPAAQADPDWANVPAQAQTDVAAAMAACTTWVNAPADPSPVPTPAPTNTKGPTRTAMIAAAKAAVDPTRNPALLTGRSRAVQAMVDLLLIIKNPGDSGGATRSVYGGHAYAVIGVSIVDAAGATLPFGSTSGMFWPGLYPRVDLLRSQVTVRNPHHTNEPNPTGGATPDGADEGVFSVDLDRFFRLYTDIVSASVPASS